MKNFLDKMSVDTAIKPSGKGIGQKERNAYKQEAIDVLHSLVEASGVESVRTSGGVAVIVPHKIGNITILLEASIKNLDYDASQDREEWLAKLAEQKEKSERVAAKAEADRLARADERERKRIERENLTPEEKKARLAALRANKETVNND